MWFAWTENPKDDVANALRKKFKDRLLGLIDARASLLGAGTSKDAEDVEWYLEFELGEDVGKFNGQQHAAAGGKDPAKSANKVAMKFLRDCAPGDPEYLYPHKVLAVPEAASARAFVLGPPRDIDKIDDLDPEGEEDFGHGFGAAAGEGRRRAERRSPFPRRHAIPMDEMFKDPVAGAFFKERYGSVDVVDVDDGREIPNERHLAPDDGRRRGRRGDARACHEQCHQQCEPRSGVRTVEGRQGAAVRRRRAGGQLAFLVGRRVGRRRQQGDGRETCWDAPCSTRSDTTAATTRP